MFFHFYFLNKNISVTNQNELLNFSGILLKVAFEGSVSQIFYLGPSFNFMLCRKKILNKYTKSYTFFHIKSKLSPKSEF